ncbi:MAG: Lhr family helicase, partial [Acidimicrobiales bacterium]
GRPRPRLGHLGTLGPPRGQGRWSLVARELGLGRGVPPTGGGPAGTSTEAGVALAGLLLERYGVLTRDTVRGEGVPGGFAGIYPVLRAMEGSGRIRRGYFVARMGAAQFALPGAVDRLRAGSGGPGAVDRLRAGSGGPGGGGSATGSGGSAPVVVLAATDPAQVLGLGVGWPVKGPARLAGAYVVLIAGQPSLYVERGGKGLVALRELDGTWEDAAVGALGWLVTEGRLARLALQRWPDGLDSALRSAAFTPTPRGLVRYA